MPNLLIADMIFPHLLFLRVILTLRKKEPRYQSCCICQFYDGVDAINRDISSLRCDDWLAQKSCSFKTKIRVSLPLSGKCPETPTYAVPYVVPQF